MLARQISRRAEKETQGTLVFGFAVKNGASDLKFLTTGVSLRWLVRVGETGFRIRNTSPSFAVPAEQPAEDGFLSWSRFDSRFSPFRLSLSTCIRG